MIPGLLALALIATAPQAKDSALSHRLGLEAQDRMLALDLDGRVALLRAARAADLSNFPAHREYISYVLDIGPGGIRSLRTEYDALPPSALHDCLRLYLSVPHNNLPAAAPALMDMDAQGRGGDCPATMLADVVREMVPHRLWAERRLEYLKRVLHGNQDAWWRWTDYASVLAAASRSDEAIATLTEALGRFSHPVPTTRLQIRKAAILRQRGDTAQAMALTRAVATAVARDGRPGLRLLFVSALSEVIGTANGEGNALDPILQDGAALAQQHGAWNYEWRFRRSLAVRLAGRGWSLAALPEYTRAIAIADSVGVPRLQIESYTRRGRALSRLGRPAEAQRDLLRAIAIGRNEAVPYLLAESYHNLAHHYEGAGRLSEASQAADRFIETIRPLSYSPLRMTAFLDAGEIRWKAGWHTASRRALDSMVRVIDFQEQLRSFAGEHLERIGNLGEAKRYYAAAVAEHEELARTLGGLVRVYSALGQLDSAAAAARLHDRQPLGELDMPLLPAIQAAQGDFEAAVRSSADWATQRLRQGNVQGAAAAHLQWAELLLQSGQGDQALPVLLRADSLTRIRSLTREQTEATRLRGLALSSVGRVDEALVALREAAQLSREHPAAAMLVATHVSLGEALTATGRPLEALEVFDVAARESRSLTGSLEADFDRVRYRDRNMAPFDGAIRALLRLPASTNTIRRLMEWSQRRKAAALAQAIQRTNGSGRAVAPLSIAEIQSRLDRHDALIDYVVSDSSVMAIVVTRQGVSRHLLPLTADSLAVLVRSLMGPLMVTFNGRVDLARAPFRLDLSHALYEGLIAPLLTSLGGVQRLVVVPDGVLHYVPFAALASSAETSGVKRDYLAAHYLVDQYESSYLPSAALLAPRAPAGLRNPRSSPRVLALTYEAPGGAREVGAIAAAWRGGGVDRLEGGAATETAVRRSAADYGVLHFAVHATADDQDPLASYLRLAPDEGEDGLLHLSEIADQSHAGQLVVLSACETQMGRLYHGEGLMGLSRAFLATGAAAVIASQWPVGATTADLMTVFYQQIAAGRDPGAALREAQLQMRSDPRTAHPFYWAAFGVYLGS